MDEQKIKTRELTASEVSRMGGNAIKEKYGKEYFSQLGFKGSKAVLKKYGKDFYLNLSKKGVEARRIKAEAKAKEESKSIL